MAGLSGSGSRARKKLRRQPATRAALKKARRRFCKKREGAKCDLERHSYRVGDHIKFVQTPILRDAIYPSKNGCTYFVMKYPKNFKKGRVDPDGRRPYEVVSLCRGGRRVTGSSLHETKAEAKTHASTLATRASKRDR